MDRYERLRLLLDKHISGAPAHPALDEIMRILFTPDEVTVALGLTFSPRPADKIAEAAGVSADEASERCEAMANKAIVFAREKNGVMGYSLLPVVPGLFEFPLMKGGGGPNDQRLGELWEVYHWEALGKSIGGKTTALTRIIPVERTVGHRTEVLPYEAISEMLAKNSFFCVAHCACRVSANNCELPREVCMLFDQTARFLVDRGFAREITRDEAKQIVREAEDAGLVHTTNNSQDRLGLLCNCCPCCCTILRGLTECENPMVFAVSKWVPAVDADSCTACGVCEDERCPMDAIKVIDSVAGVDPAKCIGCGLCVTACEDEAISMVRREESADVPATGTELSMKVLGEKDRLEAFLEMMKK